jgi:phosphatidylinositol dimannoside acyltransferase
MSRRPLFNPWEMDELMPLYALLGALEPAEAYALMRHIHAAERASVLAKMHAQCVRRVRPRLELAPRLAAEFDLDVLAEQFADYVLELNFETCFLILHLGHPERLFGELVDLGNIEVLDAADAAGPVILTPLHVGPCYASLAVLARTPLTTLFHDIPLDSLRDRWFPDVDLLGIKVPSQGVLRQCLDVLASGRALSLFPELDPKGIGPLHAAVPFLGTEVAAPTGPAVMAQRAGASLVPYTFSAAGPGRYAFHFEAPILPGAGSDGCY